MKKAQASTNKQASPAINFKGKTVVITGAGAGLGRSYALMFGKLGANVVINDVTKEGAESVVKEVKQGESCFVDYCMGLISSRRSSRRCRLFC